MGFLHREKKNLILAAPTLRPPALLFCAQRDTKESLQELQPYFSHLITCSNLCILLVPLSFETEQSSDCMQLHVGMNNASGF